MGRKGLSDQKKLEFFHPPMWARCIDEVEKLSRLEKKDYKRPPWRLILSKEKAVDFTKIEQLLPAIPLLEECVLKERELFWFLERPRPGKKGHKASFWVFFSKEEAEAFFKDKGEVPLDFRDEEIKTLVAPDLKAYLSQVLGEFPEQSPNLSALLVRLTRYMDLVEYYLAEFGDEFNPLIQGKLADLALKETTLLKSALEGPDDLTGRLKVLYGVVFRFFIDRNEVETEYLQKITEAAKEARLKGLNLAENRLQKVLA